MLIRTSRRYEGRPGTGPEGVAGDPGFEPRQAVYVSRSRAERVTNYTNLQ